MAGMTTNSPPASNGLVLFPSGGLAWKWPLAHGCFFAAFTVADWFLAEIQLPKHHDMISLPVLLGLLQWWLLRGTLQKGFLLPVVNLAGLTLSFLGVWIFPALIGLGLGLAQALFLKLQGFQRTGYWIIACFSGWILGAIAWGFLLDHREVFPQKVPLVDALLQPLLGAGIGYGLSTALALGLLKKK